MYIYIYHYLSYIHYHIYIDNHRYIDISPKKQTAPPQTASANKAMLAEPRACRKPGATGGDWLVVEKLSHPSEKYLKKKVSWDDDIPIFVKWKKSPNVPNHQPAYMCEVCVCVDIWV